MTSSVLHTADQGSPTFEAERTAVDIVCCGDSLTGWNHRRAAPWPYRYYPDVLQDLCAPPGLKIANGGIAGALSLEGVKQVTDYLMLFPNATCFVMGIGTFDLPQVEQPNRTTIANVSRMVQSVRDGGKKCILLNIPRTNEAMTPPHLVRFFRERQDYYNARLKEFCEQEGIPLADICSRLKDEHFADELHPNNAGARIIAEEVFKVLTAVHKMKGTL